MATQCLTRLEVCLRQQELRLREPFRISGYLFESMPAVTATISDGRGQGQGEASGVYYLRDDVAHIASEIERVRETIEVGLDRTALQELLPPGGARNALDCAFWGLESVEQQQPIWKLAGVGMPRPLITTFTLPAEDPAYLLKRLPGLSSARSIKLKLDGDLAADTDRVRTVRKHRPDAWIGVDANQGYAPEDLDGLVSVLIDNRVGLLEQPLRRGAEAALRGWRSPIPVAADESILDLDELEELGPLFDVVNIKLDKCGGLTEGLAMAALAKRMRLRAMVGNMMGSTLATAPAFVLAQLCDFVDLDGPWALANDPLSSQIYSRGRIFVSSSLWGHC